MATTVDVYVDPDAGGAANGTSWANAYTALQTAETAKQADITLATGSDEIFIFHCKSGSAGTDGATAFNGWITAAGNYVQTQGGYAAGETGTPGTPENPTTYSTDYYRIEGTDTNVLNYQEDFIRADKILCGVTVTGNNIGRAFTSGGVAAGGIIHWSNCITKAISMPVAGTGASSGFNGGDSDGTYLIWNCIAYGFISGGDVNFEGFRLVGSSNVYNCTAYNCERGFSEQGSQTYNAINCASFGNVNDFQGAWNTIDYCATDDGDGTNAVTITQSASDYAALVTDAVNGDFSVTDTSSELYNAGDGTTPKGTFTDDIGGNTRGPADGDWDIGAFEFTAAGNPWYYYAQMQ
ncbi:MAG TPA: hypothetical protein ENI05_12995 [Porticoccus sp.]|nr:hypothetical protein [Porticoccus sp.]